MSFTSPIRNGFTIDPEGFGWYTYTINGVTKTAIHAGVDYATGGASPPIYSVADGKVVYATKTTEHPSFGNFVIVQHKDANGQLIDRFTLYAHMSTVPSVKTGDMVSQNSDTLGFVGMTGSATGFHLHMSVLAGITASEIANMTDTSLGFLESTKALQSGSNQSETLYGDISRTVAYGTQTYSDHFIPMLGNDIIYGGGGVDTVEYQAGIENIWFYRVDLVNSFAFVVQQSGVIKGDILYNVERLTDDGGKNTIDITTASMSTLYVGSSSASTRYIVPTQSAQYTTAQIDGGGGQDVVVVWGIKSDWSVTDLGASGIGLTSNSTPPGGRAGAAAVSTHGINMVNVEAVEFSNGVYTVAELLGTTPVGGLATVDIQVVAGQDPFDEQDSGNWVSYDFQLTMDRVLTQDITIHWSVHGVGSNGTNSSDFANGTSGTDIIRAGSQTSLLTVYTLGDNVPEFDEAFRIDISVDSSDTDVAGIGQSSAIGTIVNDDGFISLNDDYGDDIATASLIPSDPNALRGLIENPSDIDVFKFYLIGGMTYDVLLFSSGSSTTRLSDPLLKIFDSNGVALSFLDTDPSVRDTHTQVTSASSGVYYLSIESAAQASTGGYGMIVYPTNASYDGSIGAIPFDGDFTSSKSSYTFNFNLNTVTSGPVREFWFRSDSAVFDLNSFDITIYELNGTVAQGTWSNVGGGCWKFSASASVPSINTQFFANIIAHDPSAYGVFTVAAIFPGAGSLPALQALFSGTSVSETVTGNNVDNTVLGLGGGDSLDGSGGNDLLYGGAGIDTLDGGNGDDILTGGIGADELLGQAGIDTARYGDSSAGVQVNLFTGIGVGGTAQGDHLQFIENLSGSGFADGLTGENGDNRIDGGAGNDSLDGLDGNDVLYGGTENDFLIGGSGKDSLYGGVGDDVLSGGTGGDILNGGAGVDSVVFVGATDAVIDLNVVTAQNTGEGLDKLSGVENVSSGSGNDRITGNGLANLLAGNAGNDTIAGGVGNDTVDGGDGDDQLDGGAGDDQIIGGVGLDTLVFASGAPIVVNLALGTAQNTGEGLDTISGIENVISGAGSDKLTGDGLGNLLVGNAGTDQLFGGGGKDTLSGGDGNDAMIGGSGNDNLTGGIGNDAFIFIDRFGKDVIADFEAGPGAGDIVNLNALGLVMGDISISSVGFGTGTKITIVATGDSIVLSTVAFGTLDIASDLVL